MASPQGACGVIELTGQKEKLMIFHPHKWGQSFPKAAGLSGNFNYLKKNPRYLSSSIYVLSESATT